MSFLRKLIGTKRDKEIPPSSNSETVKSSNTTQTAPDAGHPLNQAAPVHAEQPKVFIPGPPQTNVAAVQNTGMLAGAVLGEQSGIGVGSGAVDGLVVGNLVGQQINQAKKHEYWREQALNYQAGLPAAGVGDPNVVTPSGARDRTAREERRKNRWSRRAERRAA